MGLFREPELESGESVVFEFRANHTEGWRSVGGKLWLTSSHIRFRANTVESDMLGHDVDVARPQVASVDVAPNTWRGGPLSGGLRKRLRITDTRGQEHLFVVGKPARRAEEFRAELQ
jgi:hypothetical protein